MEGLSKISALGFSIYPITVLVWEFKGPNQKGRTEKAAPVSKRKFTSLPSIFRVTQGSRGVIWTSPLGGGWGGGFLEPLGTVSPGRPGLIQREQV